MPLDWATPDATRIELFVTRLGELDAPEKQIWLLDGGPGGTGAGMTRPDFLARFQPARNEILVLSHRGTGASSGLSCPAAQATLRGPPNPSFLRACLGELEAQLGRGALVNFNSRHAALDLDHLVERARRPGLPVVIYGNSYGSYWAQRYLQVAPAGADAMILDGVLPLDVDLSRETLGMDEAVRSFLSRCDEDATRAGKLGGRSVDEITAEARELLARNSCAVLRGLPLLAFQGWMESMPDFPETRHLMLAISHLITDCSAESTALLMRFAQRFAPSSIGTGPVGHRFQVPTDNNFNALLFAWMKTAEFFRPDMDRFAFAALESSLTFAVPDGVVFFDIQESWDVPAFEIDDSYPATDTSVLLLSGELDHRTLPTWADAVAAALAGPRTHLVRFPHGGHSLASTTRLPDGTSCQSRILEAFLEDPATAPPTACLAETVAPDLAIESRDARDASLLLFGVEEPW
ncbi:MAG: alpha/beta hydrolase [Myxococcota bacterium]